MSAVQLPAKHGGHPYLLALDGNNLHVTRMSRTDRRNVISVHLDDVADLTNLMHDLIEQDKQP